MILVTNWVCGIFLTSIRFSPYPSFSKFVSWCHFRYIDSQRAIVSQNNDILFTITPFSTCQMLQIQNSTSLKPFSVNSLMELYKTLTFSHKAKIFETFLPENFKLPKTNPPYPSSMFPEMTEQIISIVSCLLGYQINQWVNEAIIGFLSVFSVRYL